MSAFQIDLDQEKLMDVEIQPLPMVAGRVLQLDADIQCYNYADLEESLADNKEGMRKFLELRRILFGAETINTHTTLGSKAGREEVAQLQEYQANRSQRDPDQQRRVKALREFLSTYETEHVKPCPWYDREADDGMAQYQIAQIKAHGVQSSIIDTVDKDLRMVPGLQVNPKTLELVEVEDGYGEIWLDESTSTKKILGWGTAFFYSQLLTGDRADFIPGLPKVGPGILNQYVPTKGTSTGTQAKQLKAQQARKAGACGAVTAYKILCDCRTELDAYKRVVACYKSTYSNGKIQSFRGETIQYSPTIALLEQARLLWMQRVENEDVLDYFKTLSE